MDDLANVVFDVGGELGRRESSRTALREIVTEVGAPFSDLTTLRLYDIASYWAFQE